MTSKKYGWQKRWQINQAAGTGLHETGLQVVLVGGQPTARNADDVQAALSVKHGHNAPEMVRRLMKEARILLVQA